MAKHTHHLQESTVSGKKKALHKDWRAWAAVVLMLGAIGIYVLTMDDSVELNAVNQIEAPAATTGQNPN